MSESNLLELPFAPPPPAEPGRVVISDAFDLLRGLSPESVDLVVTDPPYESLQIHRARGTTTRLTTNWFSTVANDRLPELLREVYRVLRADRHFYLFCDEVTADVIKQIAKRGAFVGFDRVTGGRVPDEGKIKMLLAFFEAGHADKLLLSSDHTGSRTLDAPAYRRTTSGFVPKLREAGGNDDTIRGLLVDNPRRFLAFVPKRSS